MTKAHYSHMNEKKKVIASIPTSPFKSAFEAEQAFYLAFVRRDIALMQNLWSPSLTQSYCLHPGNAPLQGYNSIIQSWQQVFAGQQLTKLQIEHKNLVSNPGIAVHRITEHLSVQIDKTTTQQATFHAINIFQNVNGQWFMLSHHAAAAPTVEKPNGATVH